MKDFAFVFGSEAVMIVWSFHNGWNTGDFHLFVLDIFHEQPPKELYSVCGIHLGLLGYTTRFGVKYAR